MKGVWSESVVAAGVAAFDKTRSCAYYKLRLMRVTRVVRYNWSGKIMFQAFFSLKCCKNLNKNEMC